MNIRDFFFFILSKIQFTLSKQIYNESESINHQLYCFHTDTNCMLV